MIGTSEDRLRAGADQLEELLRCQVATDDHRGLAPLVAHTISYARVAVELDPAAHPVALDTVARNVAARIAACAGDDHPIGRLIIDACRWLAYAVDDYLTRTADAPATLDAAVDEAIAKTRAALTAPTAVAL